MARKPKIEVEIPPIPAEPRIWAYDKAVMLCEKCVDVDMPIAFDHPTLIRAAGKIRSMTPLGRDNRHNLPDFDIEVEGRTGARIKIKMLGNHGQIYHSFSEADEDVAKHTKARGQE